jgi:hypothetical protein
MGDEDIHYMAVYETEDTSFHPYIFMAKFSRGQKMSIQMFWREGQKLFGVLLHFY